MEIFNIAKEKKKTIIYDESFIDFSSKGVKNSIISQETINEFKNLFIIKSISNSYGVPGLSIGALISSNKNYLSIISKKISIWNINSLAEYYLQIQSKYTSDYQTAIKLISKERDRFFKLLQKVNQINTWESQANYFFIELKKESKLTAKQLTKILLRDYSILIKNCTGKPGVDGKNKIRIAVRSREENNYFLKALKSIFKQQNV